MVCSPYSHLLQFSAVSSIFSKDITNGILYKGARREFKGMLSLMKQNPVGNYSFGSRGLSEMEERFVSGMEKVPIVVTWLTRATWMIREALSH